LEVFEAIQNRRSVRAFTSKVVSQEDIEKLIDATRWAPSAGNIQPWEFVVIRDEDVKRGLSIAALDQLFIEQAPVVIVVCANESRSEWGYGERGKTLYCLQDTAAATQNLLLAAHAMGLGACWVGAFYEQEVRKGLDIPLGIKPVAIVPVGYPAETPVTRQRRPIDEIVHENYF
jgi:nitroreductase